MRVLFLAPLMVDERWMVSRVLARGVSKDLKRWGLFCWAKFEYFGTGRRWFSIRTMDWSLEAKVSGDATHVV